MKAINTIFDEFHDNKQEFSRKLEIIKRDIADAYAKGRVSESNYKILNDKISEYQNEV